MREDDGHVEITDDKDQGNEKDQGNDRDTQHSINLTLPTCSTDLDQASDSAAAAAAAAARVGADSVTENCSRDPNNAAAATSASPVVSFSDTSPFVNDDTAAAAAENNDDDQAVAKVRYDACDVKKMGVTFRALFSTSFSLLWFTQEVQLVVITTLI